MVKAQPRADDSFGTIATTGNPITLTAMTFVRLVDGNIVEAVASMDTFGMVQHLGSSPCRNRRRRQAPNRSVGDGTGGRRSRAHHGWSLPS